MKITLHLNRADFAFPHIVGRHVQHSQHRTARRRLDRVRQMQRLENDFRRRAVDDPHARSRKTGARRIDAHVG